MWFHNNQFDVLYVLHVETQSYLDNQDLVQNHRLLKLSSNIYVILSLIKFHQVFEFVYGVQLLTISLSQLNFHNHPFVPNHILLELSSSMYVIILFGSQFDVLFGW